MMIEFFRKNRRSVVGLFIVGMCAFLMLPFGVDYFQRQAGSELVATVGDKEIQAKDYYLEVDRVRSMLKRQFGAQFEQFESMINVKQKVLDELVDKALLESFFNKLGLVASVAQVEGFTRSLPAFSAGITKGSFQAFLRAQGMTEASYEGVVREKLSQDQLSSVLSTLAMYNQQERELRYEKMETQFALFHAKVSASTEEASIDPSRVEEYYNKHRSEYKTDKKVLPLIVRFLPDRYRSSVNVDEDELQDLYKENLSKFENPRKVAYQLVTFLTSKSALSEMIEGQDKSEDDESKVKALAEEVRELILSEPERLKEIAKSKGATIKEVSLVDFPSLDKDMQSALRDLDKGGVSPAFKVGEEFSVVVLTENVPSSYKPFEEVRDVLKEQVVKSLIPEYAKVAAENFQTQIDGIAGPERVAEIKKLALEKSLIAEEPSEAMSSLVGINPIDMKSILDTRKESSWIGGNSKDLSYVYVFIRDVEEPREKTLEEVRSQVVSILSKEGATKIAKDLGSELLSLSSEGKSSLELGSELKAALAKKKIKVTDLELSKRAAIMLDMVDDPKVKDEIISQVTSKGIYSEPYVALNGDVYLIGLSKLSKPSKEVSAEDMQAFIQREQKSAAEKGLTQLIDYLKITIKPEISPEFNI